MNRKIYIIYGVGLLALLLPIFTSQAFAGYYEPEQNGYYRRSERKLPMFKEEASGQYYIGGSLGTRISATNKNYSNSGLDENTVQAIDSQYHNNNISFKNAKAISLTFGYKTKSILGFQLDYTHFDYSTSLSKFNDTAPFSYNAGGGMQYSTDPLIMLRQKEGTFSTETTTTQNFNSVKFVMNQDRFVGDIYFQGHLTEKLAPYLGVGLGVAFVRNYVTGSGGQTIVNVKQTNIVKQSDGSFTTNIIEVPTPQTNSESYTLGHPQTLISLTQEIITGFTYEIQKNIVLNLKLKYTIVNNPRYVLSGINVSRYNNPNASNGKNSIFSGSSIEGGFLFYF